MQLPDFQIIRIERTFSLSPKGEMRNFLSLATLTGGKLMGYGSILSTVAITMIVFHWMRHCFTGPWRPVENKHQQENQKVLYATGNRESFFSVILRGCKRCVEWKKQEVAWKHIITNLAACDDYQLFIAPQRIENQICFYHSGSAVLWLRICFMCG